MPTTELFNDIAPNYDRLNRLMSLWQDLRWRRKAVKQLCDGLTQGATVVDVATGTADMAIAIAKAQPDSKVVGRDLSPAMLQVGREKVHAAGLDGQIIMKEGDAMSLPMPDGVADAVCVAFGMRNFDDLDAGLREMRRVLRKGGKLVALELSYPDSPVLTALYKLYALHIIPLACGLLSGNRKAYRYLPHSILRFPKPEELSPRLMKAGFSNINDTSLTLGVCRLYQAS